MHKYHFDIKINERNKSNAGTKATQDCRNILLQMGFEDLQLYFIKNPVLLPFNIVKLVFFFIYYFFRLPSESFIIVQYPLKGVNRFFKYFIRLLKVKKCRFACIIHDLDSLRENKNDKEISKEIESLTAYDAVISHNEIMTEWLKENGYKGFIQNIDLFDYLVDYPENKNHVHGPVYNTLVFAGNLARGNFLPQLMQLNSSVKYNLYGTGLNEDVLKKNAAAQWLGSFNADQVVYEIKGDFGLVWDGESIDDLSGQMGNYMRINTPHKTSLYFAAGLPVITSESAAIAPFIKKHNAGILVSSLSEIAERIAGISVSEYNKMSDNVLLLKEKLTQGMYLKQAITTVQKMLYSL